MPLSGTIVSREHRFAACRGCLIARLCRLVDRQARRGDEREALTVRRRTLRRGAFLFHAGDPFHSLCVLCAGSAKSFAVNQDGSCQVTGFYVAGELVGTDAIAGKHHAGDAQALEDSSLCEIHFGQLEERADEDAAVRRLVTCILCGHIAHLDGRVRALTGRKSATEKIAMCLLDLSGRLERCGFPAGEFPLTMSRQDIASYLGLAQETVSRTLAQLEAARVLQLDRRRARILDRNRLHRLAHPSRAA